MEPMNMISKIDRDLQNRITADDWKKAAEAVAKHKNSQDADFKIAYKSEDLNHSLHQINSVTWMAPRWPYVAAAGSAKVQKVVNQSGEQWALKTSRVDESSLKQIEASEQATDAVYSRLKLPPLHRYERIFTKPKPFYKGALENNPALTEQETVKVRHELQPWAGDHNLQDILNRLDDAQKLLVALKMAIEVAKLHAFGIVLRNVNLSNVRITFKNTTEVNKEDMEFDLKIADFSAAVVLAKDQDAVTVAEKYGTGNFLASEAVTGEVSRETDIYSLGVIFRDKLGLWEMVEKEWAQSSKNIINKEWPENSKDMISEEWRERPSAFEVVRKLMQFFHYGYYFNVIKPEILPDLIFLDHINYVIDTINEFKDKKEFESDLCLQKLQEVMLAAPTSSSALLDEIRDAVCHDAIYNPTISPVIKSLGVKVMKLEGMMPVAELDKMLALPLESSPEVILLHSILGALRDTQDTISPYASEEKKAMRVK